MPSKATRLLNFCNELWKKRMGIMMRVNALKLLAFTAIVLIFATPTHADFTVGLVPAVDGSGGTGDQNFAYTSFLTLPDGSPTTTVTGTVNVLADADLGTREFAFDLVLTSLTTENLIFDPNGNGNSQFLSAGVASELINAVGEGIRFEVLNVTRGAVFDGFESVIVGGNGGTPSDEVTITSGANIIEGTSQTTTITLPSEDSREFVSGTEIELAQFGEGVRISNLNLEFTVPPTVPEPSSLAVLAMGLLGCTVRRRKS